MNNANEQQVIIDLKSNPIISKFFAGWSPQKAVGFGQNLLIIGIGVAYKLLNDNSPEEAFSKLNKMSQNVTLEYQNHNKYGQSPNRYQKEGNGGSLKTENPSRKKQFEQNQQNHQHNFNDNDWQDEKRKQKLRDEITQVKNQLDLLNHKLEQNHHPQNQLNYKSANSDYILHDEQQLQSNSRGRGKQSKQKQRITPKITESPPPPQQLAIIRSMNSLSGPKPHLNDNAIKQCMFLDEQDDETTAQQYPNSYNNPKRAAGPPQQQYQNAMPYMQGNNQLMRSSGMNNDYEMSSSKGIQQHIKSPERLSDAYFSAGSNFRQNNQKDKQGKDRHLKKNNHNLGYSPQNRNPSQQLGQVRSDRKNPYPNVESRIKGEIQIHRDQHTQNPDQQQPYQDNQNIDDFKYMMNEGHAQNNNINSEGEEDLKEVNQADNENNNKQDDNVKEMGVHYSRTAQKKFYEKKEAEQKKKEQQKQQDQERKNIYASSQQQQQIQQQQQQQQLQGSQQMQNYSIQYNPQQQQQYYRSMAAASSSLSPSHQNLQQNYPNSVSNQQYNGYPIHSMQGMQNAAVNGIGNDSNRVMINSHPDTIPNGPMMMMSQKNTIYGGQSSNNNNHNNLNGGGKKNILDIANSFLSSPLMRQLNDDDYYDGYEDDQYDETDQMNQREDIPDYDDDFQYPQALPMTSQQQYQINPMRQSYINPINPYNSSLMNDPQRQSTGSRGGVGFNYNPNSSQTTTQNNFYNQPSVGSSQAANMSQQLPQFNPNVEQQYNPNINSQDGHNSNNTASFKQQKMPQKPTQNTRNSQVHPNQSASNQKSLKFQKGNHKNGNNIRQSKNQNMQNGNNAAGMINNGEDNGENISEFEPRQSTFITTQYKYDSGQKNNSFACGQQTQDKFPLPYKNEELFRESINNSDFTMPNEDVQQFFKNQQNFNLK